MGSCRVLVDRGPGWVGCRLWKDTQMYRNLIFRGESDVLVLSYVKKGEKRGSDRRARINSTHASFVSEGLAVNMLSCSLTRYSALQVAGISS